MKKEEFPYYVSFEEIPDDLVDLAKEINQYMDKRPDKHFEEIMKLAQDKFPREKFHFELLNNAHVGLYNFNFMNYLHHNLSHLNYWELSNYVNNKYFNNPYST